MKLIVDTGDIEIPQNIYEYTLSNMLYDMIQDENNDVRIKPITLCQDCKHSFIGITDKSILYCSIKAIAIDPDDFCKDGEPKEIV